jgi:hypothetical protein
MTAELNSPGGVRATLAAEALRQSGSLRLKVWGESMLPALWPGDVVEVRRCSQQDVIAGDIVLAIRDDRFYMHRLTALSRSGFTTRGDAMPKPDPEFPAGSLVGKVVTIERAGQLPETISRSSLGRRFLGFVLCHCGPARRLAMRLHRRHTTSTEEFRPSASVNIGGAP